MKTIVFEFNTRSLVSRRRWRSENDIELPIEEFEKRGTRIEIGNSGYVSASFDQFESEKLTELKRVLYKDLEDMVYRRKLTYNENVDILVVKNTAGSTIVYTIPPGIYENSDTILLLNSLLPDKVKVNNTKDGIILRSDSTFKK